MPESPYSKYSHTIRSSHPTYFLTFISATLSSIHPPSPFSFSNASFGTESRTYHPVASSSSSTATPNHYAMQTPTPKQEFEKQFGQFTSLFDIPCVSDVTEQYNDFANPTNNAPGHIRSISSESGSSSTVDHVLPRPTHPSITTFKQRESSPEGYISLISQTQVRRPMARRYDPIATKEVRSDPYTYITPRKRRPVVLSDDEDPVEEQEPLRKGATEQERVEHKRRLNTLAARRSRRKRAKEMHDLQEAVDRLEKDCLKWRTRSIILRGILVKSGISTPTFDD